MSCIFCKYYNGYKRTCQKKLKVDDLNDSFNCHYYHKKTTAPYKKEKISKGVT